MAKVKTALKASVALAPETETGTPAIGHNRLSAAGRVGFAHDMAHKADGNDELRAYMEQVAQANETMQTSAMFLYNYLLSIYGDDLKTFPISGSQDVDDKDPLYDTENPDVSTRPSKRAGGGGGTAQYSWIDEFSDTLPVARDWAQIVEDHEKGGKDFGKGEADCLTIRNKYNARLSRLRAKVRQAIELYQALERAADYPAIKVGFVTVAEKVQATNKDGSLAFDDDGNPVWEYEGTGKNRRVKIERVTAMVDKCILVRDSEDPTKFWYYTIQAFIGADFDLAREKGGTCEDFITHAFTRGTKDDENVDAGISVTKVAEALDAGTALYSYLDMNRNFLMVQKELLKEGDEVDQHLLMLYELDDRISALIGPHLKRITEYKAKLEKADKKPDADAA